MTINNSIIEGSWAEEGGAIWHSGPVTINSSTLLNNRAELGGAIRNRGSVLTVTNSHFWKNEAGCKDRTGPCDSHFGDYTGNGGAIYSRASSDIRIVNSTFSDNAAPGIGGAIFVYDNFVVINSTFVGNSAEKAGGVVMNVGLSPDIVFYNNIIADSEGGDCVGIRWGMADNFISDGSCFADFSGDPAIGTLVEPVDGSPAFYPLEESSLAIDTGNQNCPTSDQIGTPRPQGAACDLGAIEYESLDQQPSDASVKPEDNTTDAVATVEEQSLEESAICEITTTHSLNFRDSPSGNIVGNVAQGSSFIAMSYSDGWYEISYNNLMGWISADYVLQEGDCEHSTSG